MLCVYLAPAMEVNEEFFLVDRSVVRSRFPWDAGGIDGSDNTDLEALVFITAHGANGWGGWMADMWPTMQRKSHWMRPGR